MSWTNSDGAGTPECRAKHAPRSSSAAASSAKIKMALNLAPNDEALMVRPRFLS
jgi:hypothetical protein